jgi:GTP pyrophosphokinase
MVSVGQKNRETPDFWLVGLSQQDSARMQEALEFVIPIYDGKVALAGQPALEFSLMVATILTSLTSDIETRLAGLLFEAATIDQKLLGVIQARFGEEVFVLVDGVHKLIRLRELTIAQQEVGRGKNAAQQALAQVETLRKMLLAMASDMRVVLVRLASRLTVLRYFAEQKLQNQLVHDYARETLDLYSPLANRLGIGQLKWELEDLSFRFLEPEAYKRIAKMLEEKRLMREGFVSGAIDRLKSELVAAGIEAKVYGRPKHIYSIWNKMRGKSVNFSDVYDVRAFRVIVSDEKTCYSVLGILHNIWTSIPQEFDDYVSRPKPNGYKSLHTVVVADDGRAMEVQIRTFEMDQFAEFGVAAHWRYKERNEGTVSGHQYDEKIAWLRQLLAWKTDVTGAVAAQEESRRDWVEKLKAANLDDRVFVLTPHARVLELPLGATPIDFAFYLHSDVGYRCRGARLDGVMVPLNTPLRNGQTVEIITAKSGGNHVGPSRDWLSPGYAASPRTRAKIRAWFHGLDQQETLNHGRSLVDKVLQREGKTSINLDELARKLKYEKLEDFLLAVGKEEVTVRNIEQVLHIDTEVKPIPELEVVVNKSRASSVTQGANSGVLVVGTEGLLTSLAKCCKPAPPDQIVGFITHGRGVSIHRASCKNFSEMRSRSPEREIPTTWGDGERETVYPVDIRVMAIDRQGLLRDISEVFSRDKINVIGVNTQSTKGMARMSFTAEIGSTAQLQKAITGISEVLGVRQVHRH